jgi:hypothetical protein
MSASDALAALTFAAVGLGCGAVSVLLGCAVFCIGRAVLCWRAV